MANNGHKSSRKPRKTLRIVKDKIFTNMLRLEFEGGGKVPANLSGMYAKRKAAQEAIDDWFEGYTRDKIYPKAPPNDKPQRLEQKPKVEENGEEQSIS